MNWFERLTGFREESPEQVHRNIVIDGEVMTSQINGRVMTHGTLETPTLGELRSRVRSQNHPPGLLILGEIVADVQALHRDPANQHSVFQVASQFNLLEMISPKVTPEQDISRYETDLTQGPACAVAAGAGTIYRNYFAPVNGQIGQSATHQTDCLEEIAIALGNQDHPLWKMKNGYVQASENGLRDISAHLNTLIPQERDALKQKLRVGIQWNTEVTLADPPHPVTQVYCSALPVAYSHLAPKLWEPFAKLILEAAYEATLCTSLLNQAKTHNRQLFLTLLGGGAFGNSDDWITQSVLVALSHYPQSDSDISFVSYRQSNPLVQQLIQQFDQANH